jgi:hypothetical protein
MTIKCVGNCQLFQRDLGRLGERCQSNKFDLNAGKCKSISFRRNMRPIEFVYSINGTALSADEIKDLGVIMDGNMSFLPHQSVHSERIERVQHNFIHYAVR